MTLSDLTDPMVRALLDPRAVAGADWSEAVRAGLVTALGGESHVTTVGADLLAEAQRIAEGLSPSMWDVLEAVPDESCYFRGIFHRSTLQALHGRDLVAMTVAFVKCKPLGRLVLALRERS